MYHDMTGLRIRNVAGGQFADVSKANIPRSVEGVPRASAPPDPDEPTDSGSPSAPPDPDGEPEIPELPGRRRRRTKRIPLYMAVFSFIFGDDIPPEERYHTRRMIALGSMIRDRGGSVAPVELIPFSDGSMLSTDPSEYTSRFLDILSHFGGRVETSTLGHVALVFPKLMPIRRSDPPPNFIQENFWIFSFATDKQILKVVVLGAVNLGLIIMFYFLKVSIAAESSLEHRRGDFLIVTLCVNLAWKWYYPLFAHAVAFFLIPATRSWLYRRWNREVVKRNRKRLQGAKHVYNLRHGIASFEGFEHHLRCFQFASSLAQHLEGHGIYTTSTKELEKETRLVIQAEQSHQKIEKDARERFVRI